jgi:type IV pilus assembly protein PilA
MNPTKKVLKLRQQNSVEAGFTLIELLIVMSVMLILMTLAVPQLLKLRKQAQETSAAQSVRTIANAELQYNSAYPARGFTCSIAELGGDPKSGAPTPQAAQLITPDLASGQKAGYTFAITNCSKVTVNNQDMFTSFEVTAVPQAIGKTGDNGFCADENNTIRKDPAGGTNCTVPLQ